MKLTAILLLVAALQVSAKGYGQRITLTLKSASLEKTITEIEKQSGYSFVYAKEQLAQAKTIDLTVSNEKLESVLDLVFKDQPLTYTISGKYIAIRQKVASPLTENSKQEALPPIDIKGRVVNDNGQPVEGAIVTVKGTNKQTSTNANGEFTLTGVDGNATLVISAVNIETYEIKVAGRTDLAINVKAKVTTGDVVTVEANTGYQKVKPNEITGSVVVITNEQLNRSVSTNILERLKGITSGLLFRIGSESSEGIQDQRSNLVIRGYSTILANKQPLIIIDNFPFEGDVSSINPNDVESITVLKDAAAASIWGTRAGNGVIVITTKSGRYNLRPKVSFNSNITIQEKPDLLSTPILSSSNYIEIETFLFKRGKYDADINSTVYPALSPVVEILLKRKTGQISQADSASQLNSLKKLDIRNDLLKYYYQKPIRQQYAANLTGGGSNQQYFLSLGYDYNLNNTNDFNRISLTANNTYSLLQHKLEITTGISGSQSLIKNFAVQNSFNYPYEQLADSNGNPLRVDMNRKGYIDTAGIGKLLDWTYFPLKEIEYADNKTTSFNYRINAGIRYKLPVKGLDVDIKYQYSKAVIDGRNLQNQQTFFTRNLINQFSIINWTTGIVTRPLPLGSILDLTSTTSTSQNIRGQLNYKTKWHNKHQLTVIGGAEAGVQETKFSSYRYYGYNEELGISAPVDYVTTYPNFITGNPSYIPSFGGDFSEISNRQVSFYGNAAYIYKDRYTFSASGRRDGSNIFGTSTNNKWKPLWAVGASWDIDKESFYHVNFLSNLKLRASYGYQGNVDNTTAALLTLLYGGTPTRWRQVYAQVRNPPNPDLRWEKVGQFNIGLIFSLKNKRVSGSIEYYRKKGTDLLGNKELAGSTGLTSTKANSANIKGSGFDISLATENLKGKLGWNTILLFSHAKDWVSDYKLPIENIGRYVGGSENPIVGNPVSALYVYKWAGLDPLTGDPLGYLNGQVSKEYTKIIASTNLNDLTYKGPTTPTLFGSLLNTITWKAFSFSFNVSYKFGYYFRRSSINYSNLFSGGSDKGNSDYEKRWQKPGDEVFTNVPSLVYPANSGTTARRDEFYNFSEILIEKGDHIRLQDIRISYVLNKQRFKRFPFQNVELYIYMSNLGIIWKANKVGADPDYILNNSFTSGLPGKTITAGLNINF